MVQGQSTTIAASGPPGQPAFYSLLPRLQVSEWCSTPVCARLHHPGHGRSLHVSPTRATHLGKSGSAFAQSPCSALSPAGPVSPSPSALSLPYCVRCVCRCTLLFPLHLRPPHPSPTRPWAFWTTLQRYTSAGRRVSRQLVAAIQTCSRTRRRRLPWRSLASSWFTTFVRCLSSSHPPSCSPRRAWSYTTLAFWATA